MPFGRDYEISKPSALPGWMREFANHELKRGTDDPFSEIRDLFKENKELIAVEDRVKDLKDRIGLDLIKGASDNNATKHIRWDSIINELCKMANELDEVGKFSEANVIDGLINKLVVRAELSNAKDNSLPFAEDSKIRRMIDRIIEVRGGHMSPWAIIQMIRNEFTRDVEKEKIDPSDPKLLDYIKHKIEEGKQEVEDGDIISGLGAGLHTNQEDNDLENQMFDTPAVSR
jgi:hypothetical protein